MGRRTLKTSNVKNPFSERSGKQKRIHPLSGTSEVTCFICDGVVNGKGVPLLMTSTPYSNTQLPSKIGQLMGDGFMVIVAVTDILCKRCFSLINQLDKLECDIAKVKKALTDLLSIKYHLNDDIGAVSCNIQCDASSTSFQELESSCVRNSRHLLKIKSGNNDFNPSPDIKFDVSSSHSLKIENCKLEDYCNPSLLKPVNVKCVENDNPNHLNIYDGKQNHILCDKSSVGLELVDSLNAVALHYCKSCSFSTSIFDELTSHLKIHSKQEFFKCLECHQKFETCSDFEHHMEMVHDENTIHNDKNVNTDPDYHPSGTKIYKCNICKYHHHNKKVFDAHTYKHIKLDKFPCNICLKVFKQRVTLKKHILSHQSFKCDLCPTSFQNKISLTRHFKIHSIKEVNKNQSYVNDVNLIIVNNQEDSCAGIVRGHEEGNKNDFVEKLCDINQSSEYDKVEILLEKIHSDDPEENSNIVNLLNEKDTVKPICEHNCGGEVMNRTLPISGQEIMKGNSLNEQEYNEITGHDNSNPYKEPEPDNFKSSNGMLADLGSHCNLKCIDNIVKTDTMHNRNLCTGAEEVSEKNSEERLQNEKISKKVFVCSLCDLRTSSDSHIKRHFKCHLALERKTYKCHICEKVLTTHSNLKRHISLHETCEVGAVECNMCNEVLTDRLHLKYHMEIKHPESYQCSLCDHQFENKKLCREHELLHPALQCDICQKIFSTEGRLESHKVLMHNNTDHPVSRSKTFKCHICLKILTTYHNLKRHLQNHEKYSGNVSCMICNEELRDKLHLRQHVEEKHPENHQCSFCHKVFVNRRLCKAHEMTHSERFVYKCEFCVKLFLTEARLKRHQDIMHRDPHCRVCGKEITNPLKLLDHERRHERHKTLFSCDQCPKVFRTPSGLKYHMSVHTGKYAVYCEICGKGLHSEVVLEEHKATHTKEIRYTCEKCGRTFSSNSTYRMHRLWHDNPLPYKCDICDRKFKHTSILAVHKRRAHTGERPYKCPHCSQTFSVSSTLNKHIILHTKEYPYRCEQCDKGFTTRTKIARHMAKIHNDYEMLNAKKKTCEYKMVLHPSEFSSSIKDTKEEALLEVNQIINEGKGVDEDEETHAATLQVLENVTVDPTQEAIFTIFQQDFPKF